MVGQGDLQETTRLIGLATLVVNMLVIVDVDVQLDQGRSSLLRTL